MLTKNLQRYLQASLICLYMELNREEALSVASASFFCSTASSPPAFRHSHRYPLKRIVREQRAILPVSDRPADIFPFLPLFYILYSSSRVCRTSSAYESEIETMDRAFFDEGIRTKA